LNREKIWIMQKKCQLNSEKIEKIWKKGKLYCEKRCKKKWKKPKFYSEKLWKYRRKVS
jgi:hypothetical protein